MRGRPPKRLTPEQQQAADAFIDAAEPDRTSAPPTETGSSTPNDAPTPSASADATTQPVPRYPWEAPHVREDVTKGYPLRLPEKLYLKLKFVSNETGQSMNQLCNDAVAAIVEEKLTALTNDRPRR